MTTLNKSDQSDDDTRDINQLNIAKWEYSGDTPIKLQHIHRPSITKDERYKSELRQATHEGMVK